MYDPFVRGPHPVGVRTRELHDAGRDRTLAVEVWYPATDAFAGQDAGEARDSYQVLPIAPPTFQDAVRDADALDGRRPLVLFSHGFGGHRRQSTFYCTHLASHGYLVAACDHTGNTTEAIMQIAMAAMSGGALPDMHAIVPDFIEKRPVDVGVTLDAVLDGRAGDLADRVDPERVGISGHSFGGWTTLAVTAREPRIKAAVPLAPAGGGTLIEPDPFGGSLDFAWERDVPTLYLVAERDSLLPLAGIRGLYEQTPDPKRMVVVENSDHLHFCDDAAQQHEMMRMLPKVGPLAEVGFELPPMAELCPAEHVHDATRGLGLAHFDAVLRGNEAASAFLAGDIAAALEKRGAKVQVS